MVSTCTRFDEAAYLKFFFTAKMADDVQDDIENALNQIASTTERSGNMKKELKQTIYQSVSKLRKLFVTLT